MQPFFPEAALLMWCQHCRQHVTGTVPQMQDSVCCPRCGCALGGMPGESEAEGQRAFGDPLPCPAEAHAANLAADASEYETPAPLPCPALDTWDIDEDLRHIQRLLRRDKAQRAPALLHLEPPLMAGEPAAPRQTAGAPASWLTSLQAGTAWLLTCTGLAATVCGLALLAWSYLGARADLLIPGLAAAAAGQFLLLAGLLIQPAMAKQASPNAEPEPAGQWLEAHRRIDQMLRADSPGERGA